MIVIIIIIVVFTSAATIIVLVIVIFVVLVGPLHAVNHHCPCHIQSGLDLEQFQVVAVYL